MKFKCHCGFHILEINEEPLGEDTGFLSFDILQHKSEHTGKLFKKPRCLGSVVLVGTELKKFYKWGLSEEITGGGL